MKVAVFGATGVLGRHVIPRLLDRGHRVVAIKHRREPDWLRALGCETRTADILEPTSIHPAIAGCDAVVHLATAIPRSPAPGNWRQNDLVRRDGTAHLVAACRTADVRRYVQQSIAMLCAGYGDAWVDERTPVNPLPVTRSAAEMEATVMESGLDYRIVRGGLFYGGGAGLEQHWRAAARTGELMLPGDGRAYLSLIHTTDMADAIVQALHVDTGQLLVHAVDDCPVTYRDLFIYIAALEGGSIAASRAPEFLPSFRVDNGAAKHLLGWRPHYSSFRSGIY